MHIVPTVSLRRLVAVTALLGTTTACAHRTGKPSGYLVSSTASDYSPVLRAQVAVEIAGDTVMVRVDSGSLVAPGEAGSRREAVMRAITMEALLVGEPAKNHGPLPTPWTPIAISAAQVVADSLALGVSQPLHPIRFLIARPTSLDRRRAWLVFRIRADGETTPVHLADGTLLPGRRIVGGVRVFACADRNLIGRVNKRRAARLKRDYLAACQPSELVPPRRTSGGEQ